jgi:hypothetical protein
MKKYLLLLSTLASILLFIISRALDTPSIFMIGATICAFPFILGLALCIAEIDPEGSGHPGIVISFLAVFVCMLIGIHRLAYGTGHLWCIADSEVRAKMHPIDVLVVGNNDPKDDDKYIFVQMEDGRIHLFLRPELPKSHLLAGTKVSIASGNYSGPTAHFWRLPLVVRN